MLADRDSRQVGRATPVVPMPACGERQKKRLFAVQAIVGTLPGLGMNADIGHVRRPDTHFSVRRINIKCKTQGLQSAFQRPNETLFQIKVEPFNLALGLSPVWDAHARREPVMFGKYPEPGVKRYRPGP